VALVALARLARAGLTNGIVHLGLGAFARAHLLPATEAAMLAGGERHWGVTGVSLRSPAVRDALAPQQGAYTLALRDADEAGRPRELLQVMGALSTLLVAPEDPAAVLDAIAAPATRIVSLTITEKGYRHDPAGGVPRDAPGFIAQGLARRRAQGRGPLTLLSLDNLPGNGDVLRALVLEAAAGEPGLAAWIAHECRFPNSMVDRIVPRTTDADRERIAAALGEPDAAPVVAEPFFDWVVEDRFAAGRPRWEAYGVRFVERTEPFERLKLRMVNGSHSTIAYLAVPAGWQTVDAAVAVPALSRTIEALMREEIEPTLPALPGLDLAGYRARLLRRFANPALAHRTRQIAMDGSQKLPQRLLGTIRDRLAAGASIDRLALGVAAWIHFLRGVDEHGAAYPIEDPLAEALARQHALAEAAADEAGRVAAFCAFAPVFGTLGGDTRFVAAVARHTASLRERGVHTTLQGMNPPHEHTA
jgi:fructuronate reductase